MIAAPRSYSPVLRWKAGEQGALASTAPQLASSLTPIVELTPAAFRNALEQADQFRLAMRKAALRIGRTWTGRAFFFDPHLIQVATARLGLNPAEIFRAEADSYGLRASPLLRLAHSPKHVTSVVSGLGAGTVVGIRASAAEIGSMIGRARLLKLIAETGMPPERMQLFVDLGVIEDDVPPTDLLLGLPFLGRWGAVTVLAGSFPANLISLEPGIHSLPRLEWRMYRHLLNEWPNDYPAPGFGDFGTQHAEFHEPQVPCFPSVSVRYAREDTWLVLRGSSFKNKDAGGSRQFIAHARYLTQHADFSGATFCAGDRYIEERTHLDATPGNLTKWLEASMCHHMSLTAVNLARIATQVPEVVLAREHQRTQEGLRRGEVGDSVPSQTGP